VGLAMLTVDWIPNHLLYSQIFFTIAGVLVVIKTFAHACASRDSLRSKLLFIGVICAATIVICGKVLLIIQTHKLLSDPVLLTFTDSSLFTYAIRARMTEDVTDFQKLSSQTTSSNRQKSSAT
jgi:uncharacterized membrane protein